MSKASYLASKYLTAEPSSSSTSKKRKRKDKTSTSGLTIADDDDTSWLTAGQTNDDDDLNPLSIATRSAEFRKAKKNAWKTVGSAAPKNSELDEESRAADAIIAAAAKENQEAGHLDEAPVVEGEDEDDGVVKMGDGTHAGLQTAAAVSAQMEKAARAERRRWEAEEKAAGKKGGTQETVYRDATGRRIDISMKRAEQRAEAEKALQKEREEKEGQLGDVQLRQKEKRREDLEEAKFMPIARGVDDEEMNRELKESVRWDDPMAQFLTEKKAPARSGGGNPAGGGGEIKKVYKGAAAPNRYGIRPGYRWDGVDRGNGWEGERFRELNRGKRNKDLNFAWQMDE
jgi:pre-mRNA-splicing factor CWC26